MKTTLSSVVINIPHETALSIACAETPLKAFRSYLAEVYSIEPESVGNYDLSSFEKSLRDELGAIELASIRQKNKINEALNQSNL